MAKIISSAGTTLVSTTRIFSKLQPGLFKSKCFSWTLCSRHPLRQQWSFYVTLPLPHVQSWTTKANKSASGGTARQNATKLQDHTALVKRRRKTHLRSFSHGFLRFAKFLGAFFEVYRVVRVMKGPKTACVSTHFTTDRQKRIVSGAVAANGCENPLKSQC
ncbi:hypothetical protein GALMADRAFT_1034923 [Galerina marginata CBS 339.88]|uniref:Uncharacterized protein n=1 Tax=Galerina marginata (strain CBS 339.88) TaxID=685588 RepID=A0A067SLH6_GALM3|nr:hypothetical protein GALMADRAFT_1034923 [Galerina marginata CBS 339.88]